MNRRPATRSARAASALALALAAACGGAPAEAPRRPDVVLVVVDTLRADRLSCYDYPRETSPVLDGLAEEGVLFRDVTAQWPWTLPSMVTIFQGRYLTNYRDRLDESAPSLTELFKDAGYRTIGIVANCAVDDGQGFTRGFDHFDVNDCWEDEDKKVEVNRDIRAIRELLQDPVREALATDERGERPPLFLYLHAYDPHSPYSPHAEFDDVLPRDQVPAVQPEGWWQATLAERGGTPPRPNQGWARQLADLTEERARYDQEVRWFDEGLGEILSDLERFGIDEDAVYAFVADHGEGLWEHVTSDSDESLRELAPRKFFYQLHGGNGYQQVMATPFVMWGGGLPTGLRVDAPVENIDLIPTLLDLTAIEAPPGLHGRSLLPLFDGDTPEDWREFVHCYGSHHISLRHVESGWKLILPHGARSEALGKVPELYNVIDDPLERRDRAADEPERLSWLVAECGAWMDAYPTASTMKGKMSELNAEAREKLAEKLRALGYTELETGASND